jgi:putative ABC transport system permease protein
MKNDLFFALRMIATHRWFSAAVIVTLALGIGVNTTVFTLVNTVLFKPVPVPGGERLVTINGQNLTKPDSRFGVSHPDFQEFRAQQQSFESIEAIAGGQGTISDQGNPPEQFNLARVSVGLFEMLHLKPVVGQGFAPAHGKPGTEPVILLGYGIWKNRYANDPNIVGRVVRVNGVPTTIIGVMPEGFKFPSREDGWRPLVPDAEMEKRTNRPLQMFGVLKPGTSIAAAGADLAVVARRLSNEFSDANKDIGVIVRTFHETFNGGPIRVVFLAMQGAVVFVLLIACANVANLMLSRAIARRREIAVRAAVGASRGQIIRQLLVESVLLSVLGGVLGLGLAAAGVHAFDVATQDVGKPYWLEFTMDYRVFGYFAVICVVSGLLFGLAPALRASRVDLNEALKEGTLAAGSHSGGKLTAVLVVLQFALTVVLLTGAGLMVRSFFTVQTMNDFVPVERIFTSRVGLPEGKEQRYAKREDRLRFYEDLATRLAALPGVTHVAVASDLPGLGAGTRDIEFEGKPVDATATPPRASTLVTTPSYLATINQAVVMGRGFLETDGETGKEAALVTREFAKKYWSGQAEVVGQRFRVLMGKDRKPGPWIAVVGVVSDIVQRGDDADAPPIMYLPQRQEARGGMAMLVRTSGDPATLAQPVRATIAALDPDLPLFDVRTLSEAINRGFWHLKVFGTLFLAFAGIALLMASIGLYAVVAQSTARRTREIGIRMALGSTAGGIVRLVLGRGLTQLAIGLVLGIAGAYGATRFLQKILFRVSPQDPVVFVAVTVLLVAIGVVACLIPARRAARIEPTQALRSE